VPRPRRQPLHGDLRAAIQDALKQIHHSRFKRLVNDN
jgi:hypothetical protein